MPDIHRELSIFSTKYAAAKPLLPDQSLNQYMTTSHKNKTFSTLLATLFGSLGAHRFYLYGKKDVWAWVAVLIFAALFVVVMAQLPQTLLITFLVLFLISFFAGLIAALVIGLTPDEKWDKQHNAASGYASDSGWAVILLVILTFALGSTALIAAIARAFDLYLTGGAFG